MTVQKFVKKPVAIEALEWTGENLKECIQFLWDSFEGAVQRGHAHDIHIMTLEGMHTASKGDYLIKGIKGEFYPCKPDIFKATYYTEQEYAEL